VQGASDEFLARARFAPDKHGGAGGGDGFDLLEEPAQDGAVPDDLPEVVPGTDLLLQIGILLGELVLERLDLPEIRLDLLEGQGILDGHGHLVGHEPEEAHVRRVIGERLLAREVERAQLPPGRGQRKPSKALYSIRPRAFLQLRPALLLGQVRENERLLGLPH
jgi:hypothetical protein